MHEATATSGTLVTFDTGPLLCFGHLPRGVRIVRQRYFQRMRWTEAVMNEIVHHAERRGTNTDNAELSAAAKKWTGRDRGAFGEPHCFAERADVEKMRQLVRAASRNPKSDDSDLGESETLLFAQQTASVAMIDENAGRKVAGNLGIRAHCTLDVLIAEYQDGRLPLTELKRMWELLRSSGLDGGDVLPSDRGALRRWPSPAPQ
ncbi:hypothetical protein TPA0908_59680 [Micromonospora sp. AKA38]|nr:hypothetical protein TPA0908_59680 [Micromonospora sp. AKA38]